MTRTNVGAAWASAERAGEFGLAIAYSSVLIVFMAFGIGLIQLGVGERKLGRRKAVAAVATPVPAPALWFVAERGFEKAHIAQLAGYITVVAGVAGNLFGGFIGDWWQRRMTSGRPMMLAILILVTMPLALAYRLVPADSPLFFIGMGIGIFQLAAFYGPTFSTVQELAPPGARATVTAFYILCLNVIGLGIGITFGGWAIDHFRAA
eukprot:gene62918-86065_t